MVASQILAKAQVTVAQTTRASRTSKVSIKFIYIWYQQMHDDVWPLILPYPYHH